VGLVKRDLNEKGVRNTATSEFEIEVREIDGHVGGIYTFLASDSCRDTVFNSGFP